MVRVQCVTQKALRNAFYNTPPWVLEVPESIRDEAFREFKKARNTAFTNLARQNIDHFGLRCKRRPMYNQGALAIRRRFYNGGDAASLTPSTKALGAWLRGIRASPPLPLNIPADSRLTYDKYRRWCLHVPVPVTEQGTLIYLDDYGRCGCPEATVPLTQPEPSICAVDPGGRTFMTAYVASVNPVRHGSVQEFGTAQDAKHLLGLEKRANECSHKSKQRHCTNQAKRRSLRKRTRRLRQRVRDKVDELHRKTAIWMLSKHTAVVLPPLKVQHIISKEGPLRPSTKKTLLRWGHYRFQMWMKHKARSFPGCTLIDWVDERHTTQACGACGHLHKTVGGVKIYRCEKPDCSYRLGRDIHGARNILTKFMADYAEYLPLTSK